jgi:suppressor for copper-sensitivity B
MELRSGIILIHQHPNPHGLETTVPVFVDFTADWCLTCKTNEAVAIETTIVADTLKAGNIIALKADKTSPNPAVDSLLRKLGNTSASIPFYAVFPAGRPLEPILLDGLYSTPTPFVNALRTQ